MATETASSGDRYKLFIEGEWQELIIVAHDSNPKVAAPVMAELALLTLGQWLRAWRAIKQETWLIKDASIPEKVLNVPARDSGESRVSIHNHTFTGLSITVHSHADGTGALEMAKSQKELRDLIKAKMPSLFEASKPVTPVTPPARGIDNVDDFIPPYSRFQDEPDSQANKLSDYDNTGVQSPLPFRFFKQQAPNIITIQEFKKGGGGADEYKKMALLATLPYHKTTPQYDDNSMIYIPITGALQIAEGKYGIQAIIPTEKGRVYVDMKNKDGQESPDWFNFSQDLGAHYSPLVNDEISQFFAPDCILVLRVGETKDGKQYKNYHKIYKPLKVAVKA